MAAPDTETRLYTEEIALWMRDLFKLHLATELGLKIVMHGDLDTFPQNDLANRIPAVFITAREAVNQWAATAAEYHQYYRFRVLWISSIPEGEQIETNRMKARRFHDVIVANMPMRDPTVPGTQHGQGISARVTSVDYRPAEDEYVASVNANLFAVAVNVEVRFYMTNM